MRQRRHAPVLAHQPHGLERREAHARDIRRRVLRDERVERGVVRGHVARLEEGLRDVGAAEGASLRDLLHALQRDGVAELVQLFDMIEDAAQLFLQTLLFFVCEAQMRQARNMTHLFEADLVRCHRRSI